MSHHDDMVRVRHILDHTREIVEFMRDKKRADLETDRILSLALIRLLEIAGEAASRVSGKFREQHGEIPWSHIVSLRNRLIHGYDSIDMDILWSILQNDIPTLVSYFEKIVPTE